VQDSTWQILPQRVLCIESRDGHYVYRCASFSSAAASCCRSRLISSTGSGGAVLPVALIMPTTTLLQRRERPLPCQPRPLPPLRPLARPLPLPPPLAPPLPPLGRPVGTQRVVGGTWWRNWIPPRPGSDLWKRSSLVTLSQKTAGCKGSSVLQRHSTDTSSKPHLGVLLMLLLRGRLLLPLRLYCRRYVRRRVQRDGDLRVRRRSFQRRWSFCLCLLQLSCGQRGHPQCCA